MPDSVDEPRTPVRAWVVVVRGHRRQSLPGHPLCLEHLEGEPRRQCPSIRAGTAMSGLNEGWVYLTDAQATWAYAICGITFALFMIPGGLLQDKLGPRLGATLGGLLLGGGLHPGRPGPSYLALDRRASASWAASAWGSATRRRRRPR